MLAPHSAWQRRHSRSTLSSNAVSSSTPAGNSAGPGPGSRKWTTCVRTISYPRKVFPIRQAGSTGQP